MKQIKPERTLAFVFICNDHRTFYGALVADDGSAVLGDNNVNAMTTALELVGQDLATQETLGASDVGGRHSSTASWDTSFDLVLAASARIYNTPSDLHWWRWAANWRWSTANWCWFTAAMCLDG